MSSKLEQELEDLAKAYDQLKADYEVVRASMPTIAEMGRTVYELRQEKERLLKERNSWYIQCQEALRALKEAST